MSDLQGWVAWPAVHVPTEGIWGIGVWAAGVAWAASCLWWWFVGCRVVQDRLETDSSLHVAVDGLRWWSIMAGAVSLWLTVGHPAACGIVTISVMALGSILVDARIHRLPNPLTAAMAAGVALAVVMRCWEAHAITPAIAALCGGLAWLVPFALGFLFKTGVGLGDVKLAPVLGMQLGLASFQAALSGLLVTFVSAGMMAVVLMLRHRAHRHTRIAMGPWMLGGALVAWLVWTYPTSMVL